MISLMGLIGFLGFLGFYSGNYGFFGFFSFFVFFTYALKKYDELFDSYVKKSATLAFFTSVVLFCAALCAVVILGTSEFTTGIFMLLLGISLIVFILRLTIYEMAENIRAREE
jgi:fatty acid desaturase